VLNLLGIDLNRSLGHRLAILEGGFGHGGHSASRILIHVGAIHIHGSVVIDDRRVVDVGDFCAIDYTGVRNVYIGHVDGADVVRGHPNVTRP
jgi:hypothetical protein